MSDDMDQQPNDADSAKEKISLYLPVKTVKKIEEIVYRERQDIPRDKARRLTKSKLIELVMRALICEYDKTGDSGDGVVQRIIFNWTES